MSDDAAERGPVDAETAFAEAVALLRGVASGAIDEDRVLRLYTPAPTLALSRWESLQPGYEAAVAAAERHGFTAAIRPTGGRAAAYDESCIGFDLVVREREAIDPRPLFVGTSTRLADGLRSLGVDARVGPVPGEYCPGEFSVNARGAVKLIGTSQRAVRGARLLSGILPLAGVSQFLPILTEANAALGLDWDPATFGTLADEASGFTRAEVTGILRHALEVA
ncbi:lipoate--protein ligase family protein [Microbacterium aureliae]